MSLYTSNNPTSEHSAPEFIIVGAQKAGTTSLYKCLTQHPSILAAEKKEIHYFSQFYNKGSAWYLDHFPSRDNNTLSGEASPFYLLHPQSARRIAEAYPLAKIIIMLRDPVERAISHYHQQFRREHETLTMLEAFQQEPERIKPSWEKLLQDKDINQGSAIQQYSYLKRGEYLEQILRYEKYFPKEQVCLIESQQFFEQPLETLSGIYQFLSVDSNFEPADLWPRKPGNYSETDHEVLSYLKEYFRPHNQALFGHLSIRYNWL